MPEKEHSATFEESELFTEKQLQMEHHALLIFPDNVRCSLQGICLGSMQFSTTVSFSAG